MPGEKDLHPYQKFCVDFLEEKPQCALFLDCGLGKTIITLTAISHDQWERQGFIQTTEGNVVHYGFIEKFICELGERYNIREIAYDRWNATMMVQALEDDGFTMIPFGQGFRDMSPPTKELMRIVLEHRLNHGGHPVLRWNFDNAYVRTDPAGNLKLGKEKSTEKIDGAVALVMALDRAMKNQNGGDSVYDDRGLLLL